MKFRMTPQREVILREIERANSHPTADEIYGMVRKRLPRISLGTVYRNLEILCRLGMINKIEVGGGQKRFDKKTENHYHARCLNCGRVDDLPLEPETSMEQRIATLTGYHITGHRMEFVGLCLKCRKGHGKGLRTRAETKAPEKE